MPKLQFGGEATVARSNRASAGGCINFIRETDGEDLILYRRPGYTEVTTVGAKQHRDAIVANDIAYMVVGGDFYSLSYDSSTDTYTDTFLGSLQTISGHLSMSFDGTYVCMVDGQYLYTYNIDTTTFARHTDTDLFTAPTSIVFSDGFHFINDPVAGQIATHATAY